MICCVVFDFDGTLVDSNHIKRQSFFEVAQAFGGGVGLMESVLGREDAGDRYWVFDQFAAALSEKADAAQLAERYTRLCEEKITEAPEIVGTERTLRALSGAGKRLYVNSATPTGPLTELIHLRQMGHWFDGIYGAPQGKSENLNAIMAACHVKREEVLMVGDGEPDRAAAEEVGCHFVGIDNEENPFQQPPHNLIDGMSGLPELMERMV